MSQTAPTEEVDWEKIVQQIFDMVGTNIAVVDRFGIILASKVQGYDKNTLIPPVIWEFIQKQKEIREQLNVSSIKSLVIETDKYNLVFTFAEFINIMSELDKSADLAQYMLSVDRIIKTLDKSTVKKISMEIQQIDLTQHFTQLQNHVQESINHERYPIFKHIIKHMSKKG